MQMLIGFHTCLFFLGKYVMVMGVVRSCSPEPILRAIKMTDLSENPVHKSMWNLEVEDLHRVIP